MLTPLNSDIDHDRDPDTDTDMFWVLDL